MGEESGPTELPGGAVGAADLPVRSVWRQTDGRATAERAPRTGTRTGIGHPVPGAGTRRTARVLPPTGAPYATAERRAGAGQALRRVPLLSLAEAGLS